METSQFFLRNNPLTLSAQAWGVMRHFLANILEIMCPIISGTIWCSQLGRLYANYYYQFNYHMTVIKDWPNLSANSDENIMGLSKILNVMTLKWLYDGTTFLPKPFCEADLIWSVQFGVV